MQIPSALFRSGLRHKAIAACVGLISDTHAGARLFDTPAVLYEIFKGVDVILHAGDVGERWLLDDLSTIAPVIAVRGGEDANEGLPEQQIVTLGGRRLLVHHGSAHPDAEQRDSGWSARLNREAQAAHTHQADVVVFGNLHIPVHTEFDDILLINPGALASPDDRTRQLIMTVAVITLARDGLLYVDHVDVENPTAPFDASLTDRNYRTSSERFTASILAPDLMAEWANVYRVSRQAPEYFTQALRRAASPIWAGEGEFIGRRDLLEALHQVEGLPGDVMAEFTVVLTR